MGKIAEHANADRICERWWGNMKAAKANKSAARSMEILEFIAKNKKPVSMAELSRELAIPKTSTFELVYTLIDKGFLEQADENLKTFKLGMKLFQVGVAFLTNTDLHSEARPVMEDLMLLSGHTVLLAVESQGRIVYLDKIEPPSEVVRIEAKLGSSNPLHCTGLGKALLAAYANDRVKELTGGGRLVPKTLFSIQSYDELIRELDRIRERGYSIDNKESEVNVFCLGAPIYNHLDKPVAAISVRCLASAVNDDMIEKLSRLLTQSALLISNKLGFLKPRLYFQTAE
ncbi:MAG: IclR family transcriptional regulator [Negativicutes bacterium]|nr:IclR family transcriptional regulator [Negativicutes bacterium]